TWQKLKSRSQNVHIYLLAKQPFHHVVLKLPTSFSSHTLKPLLQKSKGSFVFSYLSNIHRHIVQSWRSTWFMDIDFWWTNIGGWIFLVTFSWQKPAQNPMLFHSFSTYS
ncbi:hypothetical protein Pfo_026622, partial [Paulownia fortunei]